MNSANKWMIILIAGVVAIAAFLFLPLASASYGGTEILSVNGLDYVMGEAEVSYMGHTQTAEVSLTFDMILLLIAGAALIYAGLKQIQKIALVGGIVGAVITLLNAFDNPEGFEAFEKMGGSASIGLGLWIPAICFIGAAVLAFMLKKEEVQPAPQQIDQQ